MTPHKRPNATPYGRPSTTKNALNEDGARGRTAVTEWNEFAVLAFFWFLFWGNAKKGTKTRSNKQKIKTLSTKRSKATHSLRYFSFLALPLVLSLSFGAQKKVTKEKAPATHLCLKLPSIPLHRINSPPVFCSCLFFVIAWLPGFALISQVRLKQYSVRPLHSGQFLNGPSADAGTLAGSVRRPFNQDIPGFSTQRTLQK
ncbi:MAG: hypothetical protein H6562_23410 [Lewinellaceae bacterium]|nr:hypothetical protein [Lewinellaceae bacterium]